MTANRISMSEAKAKLSALAEGVRHHGERYVIERHSKGVAALVSVEDLQLVERSRARVERLAGALALVGLWQDLADGELDAVMDTLARARARDDGRPAEPDE